MTKTSAEQRRVDLTKPEPGYYLVRLVPNGWQVGARISISHDCVHVTLDGIELPQYWRLADLSDHASNAIADGTLFEHPLFRTILFGHRTDETTYRHRLATKKWAQAHRPDHPCLVPLIPMDARITPPIEF